MEAPVQKSKQGAAGISYQELQGYKVTKKAADKTESSPAYPSTSHVMKEFFQAFVVAIVLVRPL
jgi:hypothetical protein